jgi:hypothetical protein
MARPPAPYARVRIFTTLITSVIWFLILYLSTAFFRGGKGEHMSPLEMANGTAFTFLFIPYFASHGVLMSMFKGVLAGTTVLPTATQDPRAGVPLANPWRLATINAFVFGLVPAALGFFLWERTDPATMTRGVFALRNALAGMLLCAVVAWVASGQPFLRTMMKPREQRAFAGTPDQYLWWYFAIPHGIANFIINGLLAFVFVPGALAPTRQIVGDTVIAFVVLTWLLTMGAKSQAHHETLLGIAPPAAASQKSTRKASLMMLLYGFGFAIIAALVFQLLKLPGLDVWSWAVYRAVVFGVYAALLTKAVAQASINTALHAEPVASPASRVAA